MIQFLRYARTQKGHMYTHVHYSLGSWEHLYSALHQLIMRRYQKQNAMHSIKQFMLHETGITYAM